MTDEQIISVETVTSYLQEDTNTKQTIIDEYSDLKLNEAKDKFEKQFLTQKLEENSYNISRAAEAMGIYPSNLHGKIKKFGIQITK